MTAGGAVGQGLRLNPMPVLSTEPTALPLYRLTADKD